MNLEMLYNHYFQYITVHIEGYSHQRFYAITQRPIWCSLCCNIKLLNDNSRWTGTVLGLSCYLWSMLSWTDTGLYNLWTLDLPHTCHAGPRLLLSTLLF